MAIKKQVKKRVPNYPDLFSELTDTGAASSSILGTENLDGGIKEARRSQSLQKVDNWKGREQSSRERQNKKLWETLYPTPNKK